MRHPISVAIGFALALGHASAVSAGTLLWSGTLTLELPLAFAPAVFSGSGITTGSGAGFNLPGNAFGGTTSVSTPSWVAPPITGNLFVLSGHAPGSFSGGPLGGTMGLAGRVDVLAFGGLKLFDVQLSGTGGAVGAGGTFSWGGGISTVIANAWTTGVVSFPTFTSVTFVSLTRSGFDARNGNGVGTARLVTSFLFQTGAFGGTNSMPGFATLDLSFVPEPSGIGAAALAIGLLAAAAGARRRA